MLSILPYVISKKCRSPICADDVDNIGTHLSVLIYADRVRECQITDCDQMGLDKGHGTRQM